MEVAENIKITTTIYRIPTIPVLGICPKKM
jgi:hypothetical protein